MKTILAGDIGGTKTLLGLFEYRNSEFNCIYQQKYCSHDFCQFDDLLKSFLREIRDRHPNASVKADVMSLSVAGPVIAEACLTTNLPWTLASRQLEQTFGFRRVVLLNDIEATARGLLNSPENACIQINPNAILQPGNRAVISVGTGLGQAFLFWDGKRHHASGTEGGHCDFAPAMEEDLALWRFLNARFPDHVSYERLLSGPGIEVIYQYLSGIADRQPDQPQQRRAEWITAQALAHSDSCSMDTMRVFSRLLAYETANLVLKVMALGGIYLTGGIIPKILPFLESEPFMTHFLSKGRFSGLLAQVPVWLARDNNDFPLNGALHAAIEG